jgi:hypothetical protein
MDKNAEETWRPGMQRKSRMFGGMGRMGRVMNRIYREQVETLRNGQKMRTKSWKHGGAGQKRGRRVGNTEDMFGKRRKGKTAIRMSFWRCLISIRKTTGNN